MKRIVLCFILFFSMNIYAEAEVTDLMQVYLQALASDPIYQQALSQRLSDKEGYSISLSSLLPQAWFQGMPSITKTHASANSLEPGSVTTRAYQLQLNVTQTIFDFGKFANVAGQRAISRQADATLNAATQNLMLRVAYAYFNVLKDEDNLIYNRANKAAFAKQLDQINQQYQVGLKTITDVYTARASYDTASAAYIAAQTTLTNDKENLRAITGHIYPSLTTLSEQFPLISPNPANMEAWVQTAEQQNWEIKSYQYATNAARDAIKQQFAGHLPTLNATGTYTDYYAHDSAGSILTPAGGYRIKTAEASLTLNVPIFEGGLVVAETNQARYNYQVASERLEQTIRSTINTTRQSYLGIMAGIQQIRADKQAIKSNISSFEGLQAGYRVGTQTLVDVLNQQQKVFLAETQYATDRYAYVNNLLALKNAAGTLSQQDLEAINAWLIENRAAGNNIVDKYNAKTIAHTHKAMKPKRIVASAHIKSSPLASDPLLN